MKKMFFFASLKSMKKEAGSGSISQRYGSGSGSAPNCHGSPTLEKTQTVPVPGIQKLWTRIIKRPKLP
jgi:hypothetical protein